ncbi:hypothetical protein GCM10017687_59060 [Streptomyces echinatus]
MEGAASEIDMVPADGVRLCDALPGLPMLHDLLLSDPHGIPTILTHQPPTTGHNRAVIPPPHQGWDDRTGACATGTHSLAVAQEWLKGGPGMSTIGLAA